MMFPWVEFLYFTRIMVILTLFGMTATIPLVSDWGIDMKLYGNRSISAKIIIGFIVICIIFKK